jgi:hypothetical protein
MCPTRITMRSSLARATIRAVAVIAWLILCAIAPGIGRGEVRAPLANVDSSSWTLSACDEQEYPHYQSSGCGSVALQIGHAEPECGLGISFQCRS